MHDHPEFLRNVAADDEPLRELFVPLALHDLNPYVRKKIQSDQLRVQLRRFCGYGTNRHPALY
jgi:hypothetical protein